MIATHDALVTQARLGADMQDDPDGPWLFVAYWAPIDGGLEMVGMELRSVQRPESWGGEPAGSLLQPTSKRGVDRLLPPPRPLTRTALKRLNVREIAENTKRSSAAFYGYWALNRPAMRETFTRIANQFQKAAKHDKNGGLSGRPPIPGEEVAETWTHYLEHKGERDWLARVCEAMGGERIPGSQPHYTSGGREAKHYDTWTNYSRVRRAIQKGREIYEGETR